MSQTLLINVDDAARTCALKKKKRLLILVQLACDVVMSTCLYFEKGSMRVDRATVLQLIFTALH